MSDHESPNVEVNETNNPDLLSQQSGMPNMSSTKKFTVDTDMQVNGDLDVTGTVTATSFIGDGSQLTGISVGTGGGLEVQSRETTSEYYIYVGDPANKLSQIQDTRFAVSNLVYDQEFATLQEAFNFMMENPLADVGYNDYSGGDKNASYVVALEQGVTHAAPAGGYLRLAHVNAQILLLSQNAVDPAGANGSAATIGVDGDYFVLYGMPQLQMGGDIVVTAYAQIGQSNIKWFYNQYNDDVSWNGGIKIYDGSTFYTDGDINSGIELQTNSYASVGTVNATSLTRVRGGSTLAAGNVTCTGSWEVADGSSADVSSLTTTGGTLQARGGSTLTVRNALEINGTARLEVKESSKVITNTVSGNSTATDHKLGYFFEDYTTAEVVSLLNGGTFIGKDGSAFHDTSLANTATGSFEFSGDVTATSFIGDGSQLTGIVGDGVGLDSAGVTLLVDSDYVQARETPQDFAYSSLTGAPTALSSFTNDTNFVDSVGVISAVTSSDLDMGGNKVLFSNVYPTEADLPDATANHGMFAHVHATGAGYFAHAGSWVQLANDADIPVGGGLEGFDVSQYDSATSNGIFEYNVSPGNQLRHLYSLNDAVSPTAYDGSLEHQVSWTISSNQQFGFRDAGGFRTKVNALANGSTATTGLVLEGETFNNSGVELVGNVKLSSLPTSDPSEIGLLWNDGGIPVFSGSTAPTGGGGLDSAAVLATVNEEFKISAGKVEIGQTAIASGNSACIAIGNGAEATGTASFAIGDATASSSNALAIVDNAVASAVYAIAIGQRAEATSINTIAIGNEADAKNDYAVAIGDNAVSNGAQGSIALGRSSTANGYQGIALGYEARANTDYSISIGKGAGAFGGTKSGILIGYQCGLYMSNSPSEEGNVFIGRGAGSHSSLLQPANFFNRTVAIGEGAATLATGETADAIAIGYRAGQQNMGSNSINIGRDAGKINAGDNSITVNATGLEVSRTDQYAIDIRTSAAGSLTYDTTNDWTFGAGVTMTDLVASGATVVFNNLPTVDPVNAGQLWNDAGTMKISAG